MLPFIAFTSNAFFDDHSLIVIGSLIRLITLHKHDERPACVAMETGATTGHLGAHTRCDTQAVGAGTQNMTRHSFPGNQDSVSGTSSSSKETRETRRKTVKQVKGKRNDKKRGNEKRDPGLLHRITHLYRYTVSSKLLFATQVTNTSATAATQ